MDRRKNILVIVNSHSGSYKADYIQKALHTAFTADKYALHIHTMKNAEEVLSTIQNQPNMDMVIAAGGDGTVSLVANALVGTDVPIGIIAAGTANVIAHELQLPLDVQEACNLYAGKHGYRTFDAMKIKDRYYFLDISIGVKSMAIKDTKRVDKKRFGMFAYLWSGMRWLIKMRLRRFILVVDGRSYSLKASEVDVANGSIMGQPLLIYGEHVHPDDGILNVCVVRTARLEKYIQVLLHMIKLFDTKSYDISYYDAKKTIRIETEKPLPIQADGEIIGETPVEILVAPQVVRFIRPNVKKNATS